MIFYALVILGVIALFILGQPALAVLVLMIVATPVISDLADDLHDRRE